MPRFRIQQSLDDSFDSYDDILDSFDDDKPAGRRRTPRTDDGPRLVLEGRSGRNLIEVDTVDDSPDDIESVPDDVDLGDRYRDAPFSSYDVAGHGPDPVPDWVVTALSARDTRLGTIKSGKEADVGLLDRSLPGGPGCLLAVKTFRTADHRMFHRDAGYLEGRRVRRSRESRAMANRTGFGRELLAGQWANAEFVALSRIWRAGARVPYPVQVIGSELMMEFIGDPDGTAAPRLAAFDATSSVFTDLWHDLVSSLEVLAESGLTHGDLSPYNVLYWEDRPVVIDFPQAVDPRFNLNAFDLLVRDLDNIGRFFERFGITNRSYELAEQYWAAYERP